MATLKPYNLMLGRYMRKSLSDASAGRRGENIKLRERDRALHTKAKIFYKNQTLS